MLFSRILRSASSRQRALSFTHLGLEALEDRRLLAFERFDAYVGGGDDTGDTYVNSFVHAIAYNFDDESEDNYEPKGQNDEDYSVALAEQSASITDAYAYASSQTSARILTSIGQTTSAPQGNIAAVHAANASGSGGIARGTAESYAEVIAGFEYDDDVSGTQSYLGTIYVVGAALAAPDYDPYEFSSANNTTKFKIIVRLDTTVIASVELDEAVTTTMDEDDTWELTASTVNLSEPIVIENESGINFFINFVAPIADEQHITYEMVLGDPSDELNPTVTTSASHLEPFAPTMQSSFGISLITFGQIIPGEPSDPPGGGGGGGGGGGAPGDGDGDGDTDGDDAAIFASFMNYWNENGLYPLIVTTESDVDNGNYNLGDLSLREAISLAGNNTLYPGADTIFFAPNVSHINVGSSLTVAAGNEVNIIGPGADKLTIDGQDAATVFNIASGATTTLRGLHVTQGGGMSGSAIISRGTLTIDQSLIDESIARTGGGVNAISGTLNITNSTIANNTTVTLTNLYHGGGVYYNANATGSIINSTISSNTSPNGGGVYSNSTAGITILNSTITANSATGTGAGGVHGTGILMHNTIVAENTGSSIKDVSATFNTSSSYNLIGSDSNTSNGINDGEDGNIVGGEGSDPDIDPLLGSLADNGGAVPTHALTSSSPAIDAGNPSYSLGSWIYDQRAAGYARILDGDGVSGARLDIGAYEYEPLSPMMALAADDLTFWLEPFRKQEEESNFVDDEAFEELFLDASSVTLATTNSQYDELPDSGTRRVRNTERVAGEAAADQIFATL